MKKILLPLALTVLCGAASADFSGASAPANWVIANTGTYTGAPLVNGSAVFTSSQLTLSGADSTGGCTGAVYGFAGPCQVQVSINLPGIYSFAYAYTTQDSAGAGGDIFGVIVNGARVVPSISDLGGAVSQSGTRTITATSSFGFFLNCTDCTGGKAVVTISDFSVSAVPEPSTWALGLAGGAALAAAAMRRPRSQRA